MRPTLAPATIVQQLEASGADHMLVFADGRHWFLDQDLVVALTGFKAIGESAVIVDRQGSITLVAEPAWDAVRANEDAEGASTVITTDDLAGSVLGLLEAAPGRRIQGLGMDAVSERVRRTIEDRVQIHPADSRMLPSAGKSEVELSRARRAASIAESSYRALLDQLRPGVAEFEITAQFDALCRAQGAEDNFLLMSSGSPGQPVRLPSRRTLRPGDIVNAEITPSIESQFSQICRAAVIGRASEGQRTSYELLIRAYDAALKIAAPGVTVQQLVQAIDDVVTAAGYGEYCRPPHMRVRGHGLGTTSTGPGALEQGNSVELQEGMIFVLHPNQALPASGYLLCGNPVVITASGAEPLIDAELRLDEIGV